MTHKTGRSRMHVFIVILVGQMISMIGSQLTAFALGIDILYETHAISQFALVLLFGSLPAVLLSPLAGALVDRWSRRRVMLLSDLGSAAVSLWLFLQLESGTHAIWQVYLAVALISMLSAFHTPAYAAAVAVLVPPEQIGRATGMVQATQAIAVLLSQLLAGILLTYTSIQNVIFIDMVTFVVAVCTLLLVRIPMPAQSTKTSQQRLQLGELLYGWSYIVSRTGLLGLVLFLAFSNFMLGVVEVLIRPLVLGFGSLTDLGIVLTSGGAGMIAGSILISVWGGPKRRAVGMLGFHFVAMLLMIVPGLWPTMLPTMIATFFILCCLVMIRSSNYALLSNKVDLSVQGRVFATVNTIIIGTLPLGHLAAGPLADWTSSFAGSQERGISLLFIASGMIGMVLTIVGALYQPLLRVDDLPDAIGMGVVAEQQVLSSARPETSASP